MHWTPAVTPGAAQGWGQGSVVRDGEAPVVVGEADGLVVTGGTVTGGRVTGDWGRTGVAVGVLAVTEPAGAATEDDAGPGAVAAGTLAR